MKQLKTYVKSVRSSLVPLRILIETVALVGKSQDQIFTDIYRKNKWGDDHSLSGPGSNLVQTEVIRKVLPILIEEIGCQSILDVPCGDFFWMKLINLKIQYIGGDIVSELIDKNQKQYGNNRRKFISIDITKNILPKADLVLCRDCLVHLSNDHAISALKNIKESGSTYLLTTTFIKSRLNKEIPTGSWRSVNLQLPPFNLPPPLRLIDEKCPINDYQDKSLGLWKTEDIPDFY
jgi:hypothetical protein